MRLASYSKLLWIGFLAVSIAGAAKAEETFPFPAFVAHDRTQLRSGPGDDHYATDELKRGSEVEVHRRVEGGWLAVRPPKSSFSWVSQRDLRVNEKSNVADVVGTAAVSWIGSNLESEIEHRWLVKLERGETVNILGRERRRLLASGKSDVFYKISPPAGEFRWLHEDDIVSEKTEVAVIRDPEVELADFRVALRGTPRAERSEKTGADAKSPPAPSPAPAPAPTPAPAEAKKDSFVSREKSARNRGPVGELALVPKRSSSTTTTKSEIKPAVTSTSEFESRLRELEAQLAIVASEPVESWNFTALKAGADELAASGTSTLDRARIQLYLDKLAEFEGLKSRHALMTPKVVPTSTPSLLSSGSDKAPGPSPTDPRFDGTGWLLPVHSSKKASPPYALLDKDGNILQFVSPAPGLNLSRYLRKEIGIFGQKDQPTTLDKPHLTAHRIVELDRHRKR